MNIKRLGRIESEINRVLSDAIYNGIKDNRIHLLQILLKLA